MRCRSYVTQFLYSVHADGMLLSPDIDEAPDPDDITQSVETSVQTASVFRGQQITRRNNMYSLYLVGRVRSRRNLTEALTSAWQTSYSMSQSMCYARIRRAGRRTRIWQFFERQLEISTEEIWMLKILTCF